SDKTILRAAYTNTLARPNYFDLVPYREIEDGEELSIGNPTLEPTTSNNVDLMFEHYFPSIGIVSGGLFYKNIKDFIVTQRFEDYDFEGTVWADFAQPINGGNASLYGVEVAFQRQLDFLPGFLKNLGIYTNYTYTKSEVTDFNFEGREDETLPLPGSPQHTLNASLAYDAEKFSARLSYNFASDFIDEVGDSAFGDRYYDLVNYLDFNMNININKSLRVYVNANNLLNQPLRYFQGVSDRTAQMEYYNARFDLGLKFDLNP
ncbi:MAG: TonB-dependent receptor, partial [Phaeodactylibacter sp.]|nr:TonB-dependent receptor [Phaeodactylibacter sp.]